MSPSPGKPAARDILVIGGGRFGCLALERLENRVSTVAEPEPTPRLRELAQDVGAELWPERGVKALQKALAQERPPVWVVPALPRHLLYDWLLSELARLEARPLDTPRDALPGLPSITPDGEGGWYLSRADFLCPDDCPEPAGKCTVTGKPRGEPLFADLGRIVLPDRRTAVVRSHQLAPGVGGYRTEDLLSMRKLLASRGGRWLLATACRCHGVINSLELASKEDS
ncbi:MAG: hypothetical protein K9K66_01860 [Desulfarculaceae bacterium]|nr:hypothetical protein [Desulfarculaceae bacterium]MCF8073472.1 hypothetical protein [Desulfarculaceae bacterium]MCF8100381.1 hypothetical protein [Desulfarculaceae bacterium]MCF8115883.1 hypothetical protein [Desulfarculaceae bacterium]